MLRDFHPAAPHGLAFIRTVHFENRRAATTTNNNSYAPSFGTPRTYMASFELDP